MVSLEPQRFGEYLCLSCGLQGLRSADENGGLCPKCGEKVLTINRPEVETAYSTPV